MCKLKKKYGYTIIYTGLQVGFGDGSDSGQVHTCPRSAKFFDNNSHNLPDPKIDFQNEMGLDSNKLEEIAIPKLSVQDPEWVSRAHQFMVGAKSVALFSIFALIIAPLSWPFLSWISQSVM